MSPPPPGVGGDADAAEAGSQAQRAQILGELAGGIVHDVNNLLAVVLGLSEYLELEATPQQRERLLLIRSNLHRGASLLRQLLGFARVPDGLMERMGSVCALAEAVSFVQGTFDPRIQVGLACAENLEDIEGDSDQVQQILVNLCVRARNALPEETGTLMLRGARRDLSEEEAAGLGPGVAAGRYVVLSVTDDGPAVPPEERERIFDPFHKNPATGRSTGLDMATVLRLVRRHRGYVTLESEGGCGNTFACHFPALGPAGGL